MVTVTQEVEMDEQLHEPLVKIMFNNLENPNSPVEFYYDHGKGAKYIRRYYFMDGRVYKVPQSVVKHVNSSATTVYDDLPDKETGGIKSQPVGKKPRFSMLPILSDDASEEVDRSVLAQAYLPPRMKKTHKICNVCQKIVSNLHYKRHMSTHADAVERAFAGAGGDNSNETEQVKGQENPIDGNMDPGRY